MDIKKSHLICKLKRLSVHLCTAVSAFAFSWSHGIVNEPANLHKMREH